MKLRNSLMLIALTALIGCSAGESNVERGNREGILYFGNGTEPQSVDPHVLSGSPEVNLASAVFEPILGRNPHTLAIEPGVAERWEFNADRTAVTFYLNPEARWSNGDPLTAEDFRWSWQRALTPALGNTMANSLFVIKGAEDFHHGRNPDPNSLGVHVIDKHTLLVELAYPNPFALIRLTYIYSPGASGDDRSPWQADRSLLGVDETRELCRQWPVHDRRLEDAALCYCAQESPVLGQGQRGA